MTGPPFSLPDPSQGLATITGAAPVDEAVELWHGVVRSHLGVTLRSQRQAREIPGSRGAEVRLRVARTHRAEAEAFYEFLADPLAEGDPASSRVQ